LSSRNHRITLSGWNFAGTVHSGESNQEEVPINENIFFLQNKVFLDAVAKNDPSKVLSSYEDGMKTLATTLAANESARDQGGRPVKVAF